mmetsp:Transcript_21179/g.58949  ORF Transcript_21179/g.58949 Transcript_21179/m.58949 type:complete len:129 (+) Transcript_21179:1133-1519(+)
MNRIQRVRVSECALAEESPCWKKQENDLNIDRGGRPVGRFVHMWDTLVTALKRVAEEKCQPDTCFRAGDINKCHGYAPDLPPATCARSRSPTFFVRSNHRSAERAEADREVGEGDSPACVYEVGYFIE